MFVFFYGLIFGRALHITIAVGAAYGVVNYMNYPHGVAVFWLTYLTLELITLYGLFSEVFDETTGSRGVRISGTPVPNGVPPWAAQADAAASATKADARTS